MAVLSIETLIAMGFSKDSAENVISEYNENKKDYADLDRYSEERKEKRKYGKRDQERI